MQEDGDTQAAVRRALAEWASDPALAPILAASDYRVLDAEAERVLHVPEARSSGAAGIQAADLPSSLPASVSMEIRRAVGVGVGTRLVRLRLDRRRLAPPRLCLVARHEGSPPVLLLAAADALAADRSAPTHDRSARHAIPERTATPVPHPEASTRAEALRPLERAPTPEALPRPETAPKAELLRAGDRLLWRSDADDTITALSGRAGDALAALEGRRWPVLAEAGVLREADALLGALAARRTFRGVPAVLAFDEGMTLDLELSGTPLGRAGHPFAGFSGFGQVRAPALAAENHRARAVVPAEAAIDAVPPSPEAGPCPEPAESSDHRTLAVAVAAVAAAARFGLTWATTHHPAPQPEAEAVPVPAAAPQELPAEEDGAATLSSDEHDAFREIARALGARYAGDAAEAEAPPAQSEGSGGAVMPFPGRTLEAAFLNALPAAILVHRDGAPLAANRRLLELIGYADLAALAAAGLDRVFHADPPTGTAPVRTRSIETADGGGRPVEVEAAEIPWNGSGATCLVLRAVPPVDGEAERSALALAQAAQAGYAAEARAALDALDDGVVTLDGEGRVVALNRGAARLFACAPREVVGAPLAGLLAGAGAGLELAAGTDATIPLAGRAVRLRIAPTDLEARHVAILSPAPQPHAPTGVSPSVLVHLSREVRPPLDGILSTTAAMLADEAGPSGSVVRRDRLGTIRNSGEQVLGLVRDFSEFAAVETGDRDPVRGPLHLNELVGASVEAIQTQAASGRILLRTSFAPDLPAPEADATSFGRAAQIVIAQAVRRAGAGGQVIVSTLAAEPGLVALRVRDTGTAMAPTEVAALDAFRADETREAPPGTGAALPLARALIEANGGRIRLSSRQGEGTLVEILLPTRAPIGATG